MHLPGGVFFPFSRSAWFLPIARTTLCAMFDSQFTPNQQSVVTIMDSHKAAKAVKPKRNMSLGLVSLLFLAPALVFYIAFELWPIIQTIWYSFYEWNGIDASTFIGVEKLHHRVHRPRSVRIDSALLLPDHLLLHHPDLCSA